MDAKTVSMASVRATCMEFVFGQTWFDRSAMRFFLTRLPRTARQVGTLAYFISSEQFEYRGQYDVRKYTIRCADLTTGRITTVGEFQAYASPATAKAALKALLGK